MAAITIYSDFGAQKDKVPYCFHCFAIYLPWSDGTEQLIWSDLIWWDQMPWSLVFWMLSFKPAFSLSSFTLIKRLFSSFLLSAIRVVSSEYLRLLIFLQIILIPACAFSSPAFLWCTLGVGDGQGSLACCSPWGHKELDTTERLN